MTTALPDLLHPRLLADADATAAQLASAYPVPGIALAPAVLAAPTLAAVCRAAEEHQDVRPYCIYSAPGEPGRVKAEFRTPEPTDIVRSRHQRPHGNMPGLDRIKDELAGPEALEAFRRVSGLPLRGVRSASLAYWGPGSFTTPHNDHANGANQLVMVISLTEDWHAADGGMTKYWDPAAGGWFGYRPRRNSAVLLRPARDARHWVEPVAHSAPERRRVTWTLVFE
ncbi:2OG-Fe(II) oxygenase [Streptomyces sp. NPDC127066]|uniref:2OG-Fe(II) oxygenase n=1 Tax=Streptomyces sp. NPDC127066 TaxID=3347125 RepID=UPI0036657917